MTHVTRYDSSTEAPSRKALVMELSYSFQLRRSAYCQQRPQDEATLSLVSILNSEASWRENRNSPFRHRVNVRNKISEKLRVEKLGSVKPFSGIGVATLLLRSNSLCDRL